MTWDRFKNRHFVYPKLGLALDLSRMPYPDGWTDTLAEPMGRAFAAMADLEKGQIANPDEKRMVGHYWLRAPELAPQAELRQAIEQTLAAIKDFVANVHKGELAPPAGGKFKEVLVVGIGGSALGPQFVSHALGRPGGRRDKMNVHFFDNTDPDGMDYVLAGLGPKLKQTLVLVISKSGGTVETRNGMLEAAAAFKAAGLDYPRHFVAITGEGSKLDQVAVAEGWLARFPMWDWVGGRTSELSAVGLLPAALQGIKIDQMLAGAAAMDEVTRKPGKDNPAALLALMWHWATDGRGAKDMVVLPYKDRLLLFSRYLQQLVMESLGKELDLAGNVVNQGIAVYGNKGSTDQHAYVQQLREGVNNFFVTFIEVLKDRGGDSIEVEPGGVTSGDYLQGFLLGTRDALSEKDRHSITITVNEVSPRTVGMLIALYERAVGFYATLTGINAYHQPGVEAGKKAAGVVIALRARILEALRGANGREFTAETLAAFLHQPDKAEHVYKVLEHLAANGAVKKQPRKPWFESTYSV
ncbi:MAG TPA: glucose-6-phosphate isomerase [Opitutaceae bacterium]|nr:glucose-6-phosphate isomerase [Opitutaceae bacterium]